MKKEISARNVQSEYIANLYFICEKLINLVTSRNVEMGVCKLLIILWNLIKLKLYQRHYIFNISVLGLRWAKSIHQ